MPIYEYQCRECSHRLEKLQKMSDAPLTLCPECGKAALSKLVSAAGFRLKGGGWYETDFKKDGKRNLAGDQGGAKSSDAGSSDSGKTDSGKGDSSKAAEKSSEKSSSKSSDASSKSTKSSGSGTTSSAA